MKHTWTAALAHALALTSLFWTYTDARAQGVTFTDIADDPGLSYGRVASARDALAQQLYQAAAQQPIGMPDLLGFPTRTRGLPGVAVLDYDRDGDLDIFVTNGPGAANSLFSNQLVETGHIGFLDKAAAAGVEATAMDSAGTCFGDIDNDGDDDLFVVADAGAHKLYENLGDGTFADISGGAGLSGNTISGVSCAMGDIDNDGLLDIAIVHSFVYDTLQPIFMEPYALNQPTELFHNDGGNTFSDVSVSSGVTTNDGFPAGAAGISWAVSFVDHDQDGDVDLIVAEDQGGIPVAAQGGVDRGFIQLFNNDGSGHFTATASGTPGSWMGLSHADFNCDGRLDLFGSNFGDYLMPMLGIPYTLGDQASSWLLGTASGGLAQQPVGDLVSTAFGWGTAAHDYDNDGDTDIAYHGGIDMHLLVGKSNPGIMLVNDGNANFSMDTAAFDADHARRNVQGVAAGDLDGDGFVDIVSVSNQDFPAPIPLVPYPLDYGSDLDGTASFIPRFYQVSPGQFLYSGLQFPNGGLAVELNDGNANKSLTVRLVGTAGITSHGSVNRSGIGATVTVKPKGKAAAIKPIIGGGSYLSQDALATVFGLGSSKRATIEVLWPGGVKNRLYRAKKGKTIVFPEIPCSYDDTSMSFPQYVGCVLTSLHQAKAAGLINKHQKFRFAFSAIRAWKKTHHNH